VPLLVRQRLAAGGWARGIRASLDIQDPGMRGVIVLMVIIVTITAMVTVIVIIMVMNMIVIMIIMVVTR
jgi:hypothetical protein